MSSTSPALPYQPGYGLAARQKLLVWSLVAAAHGLLLAAFLQSSPSVRRLGPAQAVMVRLIREATPQAPRPPLPLPLPRPEPPPRPEPKVLSAAKPSETPMTAPPPEEKPVELATPEAAAPATVVAAPADESVAPALTPPDFRAAYLNNPGPQYPYASKRLREEGEVLLKVLVSESGQAEQVRIEQSSGHPRLDQAALEVVQKRWRFAPAQQDGKAVSAWVLVPMIFELKKR